MIQLEKYFKTDSFSEQVIDLHSGNKTLLGNLITPVVSTKETGILFLHGWRGCRSGPHELITEMSRQFGAHGFPSLRFDFAHRGVSEGKYEEASLQSMGQNVLDFISYFKANTGIKKVYLVGVCSGANVAMGIAEELKDCEGISGLSVYPFGETDKFLRDKKRRNFFLRQYFKKALMGSTWKRLFKGEIDLGGVAKVLNSSSAQNRDQSPKEPTTNACSAPQIQNDQPLINFIDKKIPLQLFYGSADPEYSTSAEYFKKIYQQQNGQQLKLEIIDKATHNFNSRIWKQEVYNKILQNLEK
ncbi:MAG: hypothetical protein MK193_10940 [Lentisphaeria bacterium]|nr:hypothetical protein [Lentisphaeria bacterium]